MPKNQLRRIIDTKKSTDGLVLMTGTPPASGGGGTGGVPLDRTIFGTDPIRINGAASATLAANVTVSIRRSDAGAIVHDTATGASGGIKVAVGQGIEIYSNALRLKVPAASGITLDGNGIHITPADITLTSSNTITDGTHSHNIPTSSAPTNAQILQSNDTGELTLTKLTAPTVITSTINTASGALTIDAVTDVILAPSSEIILNPTTFTELLPNKPIQTRGFTSGFGGNGVMLSDVAGNTSFTVDELWVRGTMHVYELLVHQIRATNGSIYVANTGKVDAVTGTGPYVITTDPEHGFVVGDLIRSQRWTGTGIHQSNMTVTAVGSSKQFTATLVSGQPPVKGYDYVRLGHTTNADRRGGIYMTADDSGAPYLDVYDDVNSWVHDPHPELDTPPRPIGTATIAWGTKESIKLRLGNLRGSYDYAVAGAKVYGFATGNAEKSYISVDDTFGFRVRHSTTTRFEVTPAGNVYLRNSDGVATITLGTNGNSEFTGIMNIGTAGEVRQGTTTSGAVSDPWANITGYTGLRIWREGNLGRIGGYKSGAMQWSADTLGRLTAGNVLYSPAVVGPPAVPAVYGPSVMLHEGGLSLLRAQTTGSGVDISSPNAIQWWGNFSTDTEATASLVAGLDTQGYGFISMNLTIPNGQKASLGLQDQGGNIGAWYDGITFVTGFPGLFAVAQPTGDVIRLGGAGTWVEVAQGSNTAVYSHWSPAADAISDLGSTVKRWRTACIAVLQAGQVQSNLRPTIDNTFDLGGGGDAATRKWWRFMWINKIFADSADIVNLRISFSGPIVRAAGEGPSLYDTAGPGDLVVEGNVYVGGETYGGASSGAAVAIAEHAALPDVHHPQLHGLDDTAHHISTSTLSWSKVNKSGSSIADLTSHAHGDLTGITADQHHAKSHPFIGGDHTISGLTVGHVLRATGGAAYSFGTLDPSVIENFDATVRALFSVTDTSSIDMVYNGTTGQFSANVYPTYVRSLFSATDTVAIDATYDSATGTLSAAYKPYGISHTALADLDNTDDHTQYVHVSNPRTISVAHTFTAPQNLSPATAVAPLILNANAQGKTVIGFRADQLNKDINAGDGLGGGGTLTDNRQLSVIPSTMISVSGDGVALQAAPAAGHMIISLLDTVPIWQPISYLAGQGLLHTNGVLDVVSAANNTILVGTNDVSVNMGVSYTWTQPHTFQSTVAVQNNLTTYNVIPSMTDTWDIGSVTMMYRSSWISTMNAVIFAENTAQLIGGWFIIPKYAGKLGATAIGQTVVDLGTATGIAANDVILIRAHAVDTAPLPATEYMTVVGSAGGNTWTVTRNTGSVGTHEWPDGTPYMLLGKTNDGRIELDAQNGQRISVIRQASDAYNSGEEIIRIGNLNGTFAYVAPTWGLTLGKYNVASNTWMSFDLTNGLRIGNASLTVGQWAASGNVYIGSQTTEHIQVTSTAINFKNGAAVHGSFSGDALVLGQNISGRVRITVDTTSGFRIIFKNGAVDDVKMQITTGGSASFDGSIAATSGYIGVAPNGWTINTNSISATNMALYGGAANTARIEVGTGATQGGINSASVATATLATGVVFWAGDTHALRNTADFRVYTTGALFANNTTLSGTLNVTSGSSTTLSGPVALGSTLTVTGAIIWATGEISPVNGITQVASTGTTGRTFRIMEPGGTVEMAKFSAFRSGVHNVGDILVANGTASGNADLNIVADSATGLGNVWLGAAGGALESHVEIQTSGIYLATNSTVRLLAGTAGVAVTGTLTASAAVSFSTTLGVTGTITGGALSTAGNVNAAAGIFTGTVTTAALGSSGVAAIGWTTGGAGLYKIGTRVAITGDTSWGMYAGDGRAFFPTGTAALPSISFDAYNTTGLYGFATGIAFTTAGAVAMTLNSANSLYCYGSITSASVVAGTEGNFTSGGVSATAGGSPATYTPYRFNDVQGTGMAGSPGAYVGLALGGQWVLLSRQDANVSGLYLGIGNSNSAAAIVSFYTDGAAPTAAQSYINRVAGPNGNLGIVQAGTGGINFNTGGTNVFNLASTAVIAIVKVHLPDGGLSGPSITWSSDPDTGFYKTAAGSFRIAIQAIDMGAFVANGTACQLGLAAADNTTGSGAFITLARNTNATTPAAGNIRITDRGGTVYWIHPDDAGVLRIGTGVTYGVVGNDTANTAVGSQTSTLDTKDILGPAVEGSVALDFIKGGAEAVRRFQYKAIDPHDPDLESARPYNGEEFSGMVVDWAPRYGTDADELHPNGRSLNLINSIGDLMIGTTYLSEQVALLQNKVEDLEKELAELKGGK